MKDLIRGHTLQATSWSGGKTTQLYIYPPSSDYARRDFIFRLSTASVELEESTFTPLPGFRRLLMVLQGELIIRHKDRYEKKLRAFEQDEFDGGWETSARGRVTDFNLMLSPQANGQVYAYFLEEGKQLKPDLHAFAFIYVYSGACKVAHDTEVIVKEKDLLVIRNESRVSLSALRDSRLILAQVQLLD